MMLSKRGITPVISIILLLMLTISLTGAAWVWMKGMTDQLMRRGTETAVKFDVLTCDVNGNLVVKNSGMSKATGVKLSVRITDGSCTNKTVNIGDIPAGNVTTASTGCACNTGVASCIVYWTITSDQGASSGSVTCMGTP